MCIRKIIPPELLIVLGLLVLIHAILTQQWGGVLVWFTAFMLGYLWFWIRDDRKKKRSNDG